MGSTLPSARNPDLDSFKEEEDAPDTLITCEACAGEGCALCDGKGFQDSLQNRRWMKLRSRIRSISNTYSLVEEIILDLIDRLQKDGSDQALHLALKGHKLFETWQINVSSKHRNEAVEQMKAFNKEALDYLQERWR